MFSRAMLSGRVARPPSLFQHAHADGVQEHVGKRRAGRRSVFPNPHGLVVSPEIGYQEQSAAAGPMGCAESAMRAR